MCMFIIACVCMYVCLCTDKRVAVGHSPAGPQVVITAMCLCACMDICMDKTVAVGYSIDMHTICVCGRVHVCVVCSLVHVYCMCTYECVYIYVCVRMCVHACVSIAVCAYPHGGVAVPAYKYTDTYGVSCIHVTVFTCMRAHLVLINILPAHVYPFFGPLYRIQF